MIEAGLIGLWLAVLLLIGWLMQPVMRHLMPGLPDGGLVVARPFGLLLLSYLAWLPAALKLVPFQTALWFFALPGLVAVAALGLWVQRRAPATTDGQRDASWRLFRGPAWLAHELLFVALFLGFAWLRGYTPDITATEKPMELMFLTSTLRTSFMPPPDGWLAGHTINYYYFGYVMTAVLSHLSGAPVGYAFNLMLTTIVALAGATGFGLAANLWALHRDELRPRFDMAAGLVGLVSAYSLVAAGNLVAGWRWLNDPTTTVGANWWTGIGWGSSRILVDDLGGRPWQNITEFPWFSFILGDLHPHVLALPFILLAIGLALAWWRHSPLIDWQWRAQPGHQTPRPVVGLRLLTGALVVGSLYALNSWDFPLFLGLGILTLSRPVWDRLATLRCSPSVGLGAAVGLAMLSVALFLPFYLSFVSFAGNNGVRLPEALASVPGLERLARMIGIVTWGRTDLGEFFQIYGYLWSASLACVVALVARGLALPRASLGLVAVGCGLAGLVSGSAPVALAGVTVVAALAIIWWGRGQSGERFICLLLAIGLLLPIAAEFVFLQDVFSNRMNTVFKVYYQSWTILSLVAAVGLGMAVRAVGEIVQRPADHRWLVPTMAGSGLLVALLLVTAGYPLIATRQRAEGVPSRRGLDGLAYLVNQPDEQAALAWAVANIPPGTVVAEDPGRSYGDYQGVPHARVATVAGTLAPLGWPGHEQQWRANQPAALAEVGRRLNDIQELYSTTDMELARRIIDRHGIQYVYIGQWERATRDRERVYSPAALGKFGQFMDVAFQRGQVTIYRRRA